MLWSRVFHTSVHLHHCLPPIVTVYAPPAFITMLVLRPREHQHPWCHASPVVPKNITSHTVTVLPSPEELHTCSGEKKNETHSTVTREGDRGKTETQVRGRHSEGKTWWEVVEHVSNNPRGHVIAAQKSAIDLSKIRHHWVEQRASREEFVCHLQQSRRADRTLSSV